ncbi:MAG: hypothetical protein JXB25_02645, partial [Deltaproteobacteria bacterium]|nr:hypothetical protein [Deltaproteobacteria bacterium]
TAVYQGGTAHTGEAGGEADIKAYMAHAEIGVNIEKFSVRVGGLYMTGDDEADNDVENYFGIDTDNTMLGSVVLFECLDPMTYYAFYGPQAGRYGAMHLYAHFGVELDKNTDLRVGALWLNAAEDIVYIDGSGQKDNNLGYEINAELTHKITKNLTFALAGGYLIAEDGADALASDGDSDDLWKVISMFRFKF